MLFAEIDNTKVRMNKGKGIFNLLFRIYTEPLLLVYLYDIVNRNRRNEVFIFMGRVLG